MPDRYNSAFFMLCDLMRYIMYEMIRYIWTIGRMKGTKIECIFVEKTLKIHNERTSVCPWNFLCSVYWLTSQVSSSLEFGSGYTTFFFIFLFFFVIFRLVSTPASFRYDFRTKFRRGALDNFVEIKFFLLNVSFGTISWKFDDRNRS